MSFLHQTGYGPPYNRGGREAEVISLPGVAGCATSPAATVALVFVLQEGLQLPTGYKESSIIPKIGSKYIVLTFARQIDIFNHFQKQQFF
jgi:hypothetical protein